MSRKFRKQYSAYQSHILADFMSKKELEELAKKYNDAKINRLLTSIKKELSK